VLVASTALILLSPVMLMTAALVKFTSPGPILFRPARGTTALLPSAALFGAAALTSYPSCSTSWPVPCLSSGPAPTPFSITSITGLAQVNGLRGETQTLESMADRVQYELACINNWSIWLDFKIMLRTVFVLTGKDVY
jgi:lipopolysaccharide/colanic/teichoic acid biosynthesis glycosyltransferase